MYDIDTIKMVEQRGKSRTSTTANNIQRTAGKSNNNSCRRGFNALAEVLTQPTDATNVPQRYGQTATVRSTSYDESRSQQAGNSAYKAQPPTVRETTKEHVCEKYGTQEDAQAARRADIEEASSG